MSPRIRHRGVQNDLARRVWSRALLTTSSRRAYDCSRWVGCKVATVEPGQAGVVASALLAGTGQCLTCGSGQGWQGRLGSLASDPWRIQRPATRDRTQVTTPGAYRGWVLALTRPAHPARLGHARTCSVTRGPTPSANSVAIMCHYFSEIKVI
jgi:hypothetical protein